MPTDVSAGGHSSSPPPSGSCVAERYEEAERAYDERRRRGPPARLERRLRGRLEPALAVALPPRPPVRGRSRRASPRWTCATTSTARRASSRPRSTRSSSRARRGTLDRRALAAGRRLHGRPARRGPALRRRDARPRLPAGGARRRRGGLEELLACGQREQQWGVGNPPIIAWRSAPRRCLPTLGRLDQARALAAEELELARAFGAPRAIGVALRASALVEAGERPDHAAQRGGRDARALARARSSWPARWSTSARH